MPLSASQLDRAVGAVVASAAGDALGSHYEFGPPLPDTVTPEFRIGYFGHDVGEWTDDTSMSIPMLELLASGGTLEDPASLAGILRQWKEWAQTSKDVGAQTRSVLGLLTADATEDAALAAAQSVHARAGRSGGNGSLMRTGPIALGYLDRTPEELAAIAGRVARLTHWEPDNADACALWSLAIRHAILTDELDIRSQVTFIPQARRDRWVALIDEATQSGVHPRDFAAQNGWVVKAFQAALAAITDAGSLKDVLERAVRGGADTDTVAAIAGSLAGAVWGASALPTSFTDRLHGWPGIDADELARLARLASGA